MKISFLFIFFCALLALGNSCNNSHSCDKFSDEIYPDASTNLPDSIRTFIESYLVKRKEPMIRNSEHECYRLSVKYAMSSSSNSFLFRKAKNNMELIFKEFDYENDEYRLIEEYRAELSEFTWDHLQYLIYKFEFWTEKEMNIQKDIRGGYSFILEGNRPAAKLCSKKSEKITVIANSNDTHKLKWLSNDLISIYLHSKMDEEWFKSKKSRIENWKYINTEAITNHELTSRIDQRNYVLKWKPPLQYSCWFQSYYSAKILIPKEALEYSCRVRLKLSIVWLFV